MSDTIVQLPGDAVRVYDLLDERKRSRARLPTFEPTMELINDRFCRYLRSALLHHLRRPVEVSCVRIECVSHRALLEGFKLPSYMTLIGLRPLQGALMIELDARLVAAIVESRFGGDGRFPVTIANREFSPVEQKSMRRVTESILMQLATAWEPVGRFEPEILRQEVNPQFAGFAAVDDTIVVNEFEVRIERAAGQLVIAIPYSALEPLRDQLVVDAPEDSAADDLRWQETLRASVAQAGVTLTAELTRIEISVADLVSLQPGNVFEMDRNTTATVMANGMPLFRGAWGRRGRTIAVRVDEHLVIPPADR
ncbi:MAG: flagellar motor switch protein FliM [Alphaproteobacteria bacterium]|nr:flagellar motor switch protein FliM [Alphaproteobacteria bacterium]